MDLYCLHLAMLTNTKITVQHKDSEIFPAVAMNKYSIFYCLLHTAFDFFFFLSTKQMYNFVFIFKTKDQYVWYGIC